MTTTSQNRHDLVVRTTTDDGIATLRFNNPHKLNAWSSSMRDTFRVALAQAGSDERG